ncbi:MAG: isocitrate lyase/phosphoenolpyruvate mutase family protein [Solirubrobacterales bacterium]|nr:isocitrate lyase/phosphoenolpyruvate mutase family protein [Solirubrobacterales bacterium]
MADQAAQAQRFLELHRPGQPLLLPNAWDAGSARILAWLGFEALATTSSGHAATLGRLDGSVSRDEALGHARQLVAATELPVSADLENGFADAPAEVAETFRLAWDAGLVGASIEDFSGDPGAPIYGLDLAVDRVAAAAQEAHGNSAALVLTARCENHLHGRDDLGDTVGRLRAYQEAGADVLYAPGLARPEDIRAVVEALDRPVNVLARPNGPSVAELASLGVSRISVGGALAFAALGELVEAAEEFRQQGTFSFLERSQRGAQAAGRAFPPRDN